MSGEGVDTWPPHLDDGAPNSFQAEQSPSRRNSSHNAKAGHQSRQVAQEPKSPSITGSDTKLDGEPDGELNGEPTRESAEQPAQQMNGIVNKEPEIHETETPEVQASAEQPLGNPKDPLEDYAWEDLELRFTARMEECKRNEEALGQEFSEWLKVFGAWASVVEVHEEERASKRLRTREAYVQDKEAGLEKKRQHYLKVVKAFESALALLAE